MDNFFGKKKTPKQQAKESKRQISRAQRDIERDRAKIEREEKNLIQEIKKSAKQGNQASTRVLAKQLVQVRAQKDKMLRMNAQLGGIGMQTTAMASQMTMTSAMQNATKAMGSMNKTMDMAKVQETLREFEKQNEIMSMQEEMIEDTLIDAFDDEEAEAEEDSIVNQVLAEVGIEQTGGMMHAPVVQEDAVINEILNAPSASRAKQAI